MTITQIDIAENIAEIQVFYNKNIYMKSHPTKENII